MTKTSNQIEAVLAILFCIISIGSCATGRLPPRCVCNGMQCSCCTRFLFNRTFQEACANTNYIPEQFTFNAEIVMNGQVLASRSLGPHSIPLCSKVPLTPLRICLIARTVQVTGDTAKACLTLSVKALPITLASVPFPCLTLGSGQFSVSRN